ncbi:uncharacterized protein LY89DRAFT_738575 [Mollisia scopiformis]|uniref:Uncharacterized protein n=1 Tax=Mollisia scopiformis TaxID=149040 RepID=A0A194WW94_MOLSC|nr:uncharacterized protein LY89DRAFT_738575 [Mollisia scopiformis]KUJ11939.1 hypothetical protein LY89DRAFT_738575 [Mollisia scopiformis]
MSGVLEALGMQLGCQALWPLLEKLFKLIRRMTKAFPEAKEFWKIFKRQYKTLKATAASIVSRYDIKNTNRTWLRSINHIAAEAKSMFWALIKKIETVLSKDYIWRTRWAIVYSGCKKASLKMAQLNDELLRIETVVRLEYEDAQQKKAEKAEKIEQERRRKAMKTGTIVGGGVGFVVGAGGTALFIEATLKGAAIGGIVGAVVGAGIGLAISWFGFDVPEQLPTL